MFFENSESVNRFGNFQKIENFQKIQKQIENVNVGLKQNNKMTNMKTK